MAYGLSGSPEKRNPDLLQDLVNFLLIRGPYSWLGWGWNGCSREYYFPPEFNVDYGQPIGNHVCQETTPNSEVFIRKYSKSTVMMDCKKWQGSVTFP